MRKNSPIAAITPIGEFLRFGMAVSARVVSRPGRVAKLAGHSRFGESPPDRRPGGTVTHGGNARAGRPGRAGPPHLPVDISQQVNKKRSRRRFFTTGEKFTR